MAEPQDGPGQIDQLRREMRRAEDQRAGWSTFVFVVAVLALLTGVLGAGLGWRALADSNGATTASADGAPKTVAIELGDLFVRPSSIDIPAGTDLTLEVTNTGAMPHDLKLEGETGTALLDPGAHEVIQLGAMDASAQAWCTVPGHKEAGMLLDINVTGAPDAGTADGGDAASDAATIDFAAEPSADFTPYDPALAPAPGGTEHELTMHATETVMEVAPGVTQEMWTFDDQVPGPVLRGRVGDIFTITLVNDGKLGHSIDLHASKVAWNDEMRTIEPGESLVYQFEAKHAGIFMYHCGTAPALHHIGNGMFGAIIIDPPVLAPVDHEYVLVQSELYLGAQGAPGDLTKMQSEAHDAVVFNGYVNQYLSHPIRVEPDERVRVWVLDAGPSENSAFHIVGTIFDTVFKEGTYLIQPDARRAGSQALDLQPSQGGFVEFSFDEAGHYPIVTHKFANVGKGALGLFQAGEVESTEGAGH